MKIKKTGTLGVALCALAWAMTPAHASVIVSNEVTGSSGAWTHTFTVDNSLGGTNQIYFFGVNIDAGTEISAPSGFNSTTQPTWDRNGLFGGSSTLYNNVWLGGRIASGSSGEFVVLETSAVASSVIPWFAYAFGDTYLGGDNFNRPQNPGFEGVVGTAAAVPEPATWAMLLLGFFGIGGAMRSSRIRQNVSVSFG